MSTYTMRLRLASVCGTKHSVGADIIVMARGLRPSSVAFHLEIRVSNPALAEIKTRPFATEDHNEAELRLR